MGHQPEYCQSHSHEQTEPDPSFGREKAEQIAFHLTACRNHLNLIRLISHVIITSLMVDRAALEFSVNQCFYFRN